MENTITIIGGDARFLHTRQYFIDRGYKVNSVFLSSGENSLKKVGKTVVLPLPAARMGKLNAPFADGEISLDAVLDALDEKAQVFGGMLPKNFILKSNERGIKTFDYYENEMLLTENAFLTAKGLKKMLSESRVETEYEKALVVGFGRCGKAISSVLAFSGADVTVVSSKAKSIVEYSAIPFEKLEREVSRYSLIVNTVPSLVIDENVISRMKKNAVIAEIASAPYGIDFGAAQRYDIKTIKAVSLPGKYFPEEAGVAIAKTIEFLREGG